MFAKSKVSQSMIDAVNKVLGEEPVEQKDQLLNETAPLKEPTPTGMRVYGGSYGNSAKAKKDQTKSPVDNLKGPKDKEMKEELKSETFEFHLTEGSYADLHKKWGDTHNIEYHSHTLYPKHTVTKFDNEKDAESHAKKNAGTVRMSVSPKMKNEELKGNQDKIDTNHNDKIDAQDFKILKAKKKVKEGREFTDKLLETVRKSDVPAYLRKAKGDTPLTVADAKGPKKDTISAPENLAKARNEEVELNQEINEVLSKDASAGDWIHDFVHSDNPKFAGKSTAERKKMALGAYYDTQKEEADITTDTLAGRTDGGKDNSFKKFKVKLKGDGIERPMADKPESTPSRASIKSEEVEFDEVLDEAVSRKDFQMVADLIKTHDHPGKRKELAQHHAEIFSKQNPRFDHAKFMKAAGVNEATIAGSSGWEPMKKDVKDKSGAVHTPMSRAKDLARQAFKTVSDKTKVKEQK